MSPETGPNGTTATSTATGKRLRILLADDHQVVIEGLRRILETEFKIVGVVTDGQAMVRASARLKPDILVADVTMPLLNGLEAARQILKASPESKIVFLTMHPDVTYALDALDAGAFGYVLKSSAGQQLVTAIHEAVKGRVYVTPSITARSVRSRCGRPPVPRQHESQPLTPRQREVARLVAEGRPAKEIADLLKISVRTVEFHKYQAMESLGLKSVAELVQFAIRRLA
jgi:DNA-binding NarL/FixJ family response regulator